MTFKNNIVDLEVPVPISQGGFQGTTIQDSQQYMQYGLFSAKNAIIGGNFDMNPWQRGTSFISPTAGTWTADMWSYHFSGPAVVTITKDNDSPTVVQSNIFGEFNLSTAVTTPEPIEGAGSYYFQRTRVEAPNPYLFVETITLSFWVFSGSVGTYSVRFLQNNGSNNIYIAEYEVFNRNTWEFKTITLTTPELPDHLYIDFIIACGIVNQTATINAWFPGNAIASIHQVNGVGNDGLFKLQYVQLESGDVYSGFELRDAAEELYLCQRYLEKSYFQNVDPGTPTAFGQIFAVGSLQGSNAPQYAFSEFIPFKVQKPDSFSGELDLYSANGQYFQWQWFDAAGTISVLDLFGSPGPLTLNNSNGFSIKTLNSVSAIQVACKGHYVARWEF